MGYFTRSSMTERSNEQWLAELTSAPERQAAALQDLRQCLQGSIFYYLSHERSDLRGLSNREIACMAEDLAQEAILRVLENLDTFRGESRFTTWANKIAVRLAIGDLRRARYKDSSLESLTADGELLLATSNPALKGNNLRHPEIATERSDMMAEIGRALKEALTEGRYQALVAVALKEMPMDVVAEQLGTNRNALYKRLHDARRKLRSYLEARGLSVNDMMDLFQS